MEDEKEDWLINGCSGCPVQLPAKNLCLENAKTHKYLEAPKGSDEYPPKRPPVLSSFAITFNLLQYFCQLTLSAANSRINIIDKLETQLEDVDLLVEKEVKSGVLSETMISDIFLNALGEKKNDVLTYVHNTRNSRLYFNKERNKEPFVRFPEGYTEALMPKMWKAALMRCALKLETYCDRLQHLMKGHFDTEFIIHFLLDGKLGYPKLLQRQIIEQVLETELRDKNLTEVIHLLKRKLVISVNYINEQWHTVKILCQGEDTKKSPDGIPRFPITRYGELLRERPDLESKLLFEIKDRKSSLINFISIDVTEPLSVDSKRIKISNFQNIQRTLRRRSKIIEDKSLTLTVSKSKFDLRAMVLTVLAEQIEIWEAMQRMTPCTQEEASPPTACSDPSSLSHSESLSSLEWEDSPTDTLRQLLVIARGRKPLPPDGSALFIILVPIIDLMAKSDEEPKKIFLRFATSSTKEDNGNDMEGPSLFMTLPLITDLRVKSDEETRFLTSSLNSSDTKDDSGNDFQTFNNHNNLEQIEIKVLSSSLALKRKEEKEVYEQEEILKM